MCETGGQGALACACWKVIQSRGLRDPSTMGAVPRVTSLKALILPCNECRPTEGCDDPRKVRVGALTAVSCGEEPT